MRPRIPCIFSCALLLIAACCPDGVLSAEAGNPVRYHFGDDLRWADAAFDDGAWPAAQDGRWPLPPAASDGFEWARARVAVPADASGPLALRISGNNSFALSYQVFVNGRALVQRGTFPPHPEPRASFPGIVFELPAGVVSPGSTAVIAWRVWSQTSNAYRLHVLGARFQIDESRNLHLANQTDHIKKLLSVSPDLALNALLALMGIGLFLFWRRGGGREMLLYAGVLLLYSVPEIYAVLYSLEIVRNPWQLYSVLHYALQEPQMAITVEFIWTIHSIRAPGLKALAHFAAIVLNATTLYVSLITSHSAAAPVLFGIMQISVQAFNFITIGTNMWAFLVRRQNRAIAAALVIIPVASALRNIGIPIAYVVGNVSVDFFSLGFLVSATALFITLGQRARAGWRSRDELRVEFEAAREVQQQLVAPAVDVPGFKIDSVYAPAKQVGGDFFRVLPEPGGSVLVVVGDVSGKGLRAAMTVSAIIGALRTMPALSPPRILSDLNRGLAGQLRGGFVTCCVARIDADGEVAIANAGHLSPYRAGAEVDVPAGFPLGLVPDATYDEAHFRLHSGEVLTFLSDGVIEARNSSGELFGFERTLAISTSSAETIAQAAIDFGQDDDITVLTLTNLPAARLDPDPHKGPMLVTA